MPEIRFTYLRTLEGTFVPISLVTYRNAAGRTMSGGREMAAGDARRPVPGAGTMPSASELLFGLCHSPYLVRFRRFFALDVDCSTCCSPLMFR